MIRHQPHLQQETNMKSTEQKSSEPDKTLYTTSPGPDMRTGPGPALMGSSTLVGNGVYNEQGEDLGEIKEIMIDMRSGKIGYAVMAIGGFLGMGGKLFAVPWQALKLDTEHKSFMLKVDKGRLNDAPGFDKDKWPDMADQAWSREIHRYYGIEQ
jgi:sporulation protein YlmC with PRC-barrel domain